MRRRMVNLAGPHAKPDPGDLMAWYDRHRRDLPWRAKPGEAPEQGEAQVLLGHP